MGDVPTVRCFADAARLRQVVVNLLGNAIKFTSSGVIELRTARTASDRLRVEVADTGPGIAGGQRGKLFQTFERLDTTPVQGIQGSGLGLALSAQLVQLMGGQVGHDDNPGGGSVFWLELPLRADPVALPADAPAQPRRRPRWCR